MADEQSNTGVISIAVPTSGFTDAEFLEKPLSHKVTHPLPLIPDPTCLHGPNYLKWQRFVETAMRPRQLFKHCTEEPLPLTHTHYAAWETEEQFVLGWFVTHTLTQEYYDHFPHQKTVKGFWDQARTFCGREGDNWQFFGLICRANALHQGTLTISEYALSHQSLWDKVDYYLPTDDPKCLSYQNTLLTHLLGFLSGLNREYDDIHRHALHCLLMKPLAIRGHIS